MRFSGEYEIETPKGMLSTLESRELFFRLIGIHKKQTVNDFLNPIKNDVLPRHIIEDPHISDQISRFFILHLVNPFLFSIELEEFGIANHARNTPILAFAEYIFANKAEYEKIKNKNKSEMGTLSQEKEIIEQQFPNWSKLQRKKKAKHLCSVIKDWAEKSNLTDEWCLDFLVDVLRCFKVNFLKNNELNVVGNAALDLDYFIFNFTNWFVKIEAWNQAVKNLFDYNLSEKFISLFDEKPPVFHFQYKGVTISDACHLKTETFSKFKARVDASFTQQLVSIVIKNKETPIGIKTRFHNALDKYWVGLKKHNEEGALLAPQKRSGDKHFRWLIEYQILPYKTYSEIASENEIKSVKSVKEAVYKAALLLKLDNLRQTNAGRPPGAKDKIKRNYRRQ